MDMELRVIPTERYFDMVRAQLTSQKQAFVRVTGVSMQPILRHLKDGVLLAPAEHIAPGDVVLFDRRNGHYALHRVVSVRGDRFSMMGDNQWHMDRGLPVSQIVGKVSCYCRGERRLPVDRPGIRLYAAAAVGVAWAKWLLGGAVRRLRRMIKGGGNVV